MCDETSRSRGHGDQTERGADVRDGAYHETFRVDLRDADDLCVAIVRSVAAITGADPVALPPLARSVDPEALRLLVSGERGPASGLCVTFTYADCFASIGFDGELKIRGPAV